MLVSALGLLIPVVPSEDRQCHSVHSEVQMALPPTHVTKSCGCVGITLSTPPHTHTHGLLSMLLFSWTTNRWPRVILQQKTACSGNFYLFLSSGVAWRRPSCTQLEGAACFPLSHYSGGPGTEPDAASFWPQGPFAPCFFQTALSRSLCFLSPGKD